MNKTLEKIYETAVDIILGILVLFLIIVMIVFIYKAFEIIQNINPIYVISLGIFYIAYKIGKYIRSPK